jgi:hypothetical protein
MSNVISIKNGREIGFINGVAVPSPRTKQDILDLCKQFLTLRQYELILLSIMDKDLYKIDDQHLLQIIECYFAFPD